MDLQKKFIQDCVMLLEKNNLEKFEEKSKQETFKIEFIDFSSSIQNFTFTEENTLKLCKGFDWMIEKLIQFGNWESILKFCCLSEEIDFPSMVETDKSKLLLAQNNLIMLILKKNSQLLKEDLHFFKILDNLMQNVNRNQEFIDQFILEYLRLFSFLKSESFHKRLSHLVQFNKLNSHPFTNSIRFMKEEKIYFKKNFN